MITWDGEDPGTVTGFEDAPVGETDLKMNFNEISVVEHYFVMMINAAQINILDIIIKPLLQTKYVTIQGGSLKK